jgi:hypothetical protein
MKSTYLYGYVDSNVAVCYLNKFSFAAGLFTTFGPVLTWLKAYFGCYIGLLNIGGATGGVTGGVIEGTYGATYVLVN